MQLAVPVKRISPSKSTRVILITPLWQAKLLSRTAGQNWPLVGDCRNQLLSLIHYPHNNGSARLATGRSARASTLHREHPQWMQPVEKVLIKLISKERRVAF